MRSCHPCFCEQGRLSRPVPMSKIAAEGISTIWMSTGADSLKTIDFYRIRKQDYVFRRRGQCGIDGRSRSRDRRETEAGTLAGLVYRTLSRWSYRSGLCIAKVYRQSRNLLDLKALLFIKSLTNLGLERL